MNNIINIPIFICSRLVLSTQSILVPVYVGDKYQVSILQLGSDAVEDDSCQYLVATPAPVS